MLCLNSKACLRKDYTPRVNLYSHSSHEFLLVLVIHINIGSRDLNSHRGTRRARDHYSLLTLVNSLRNTRLRRAHNCVHRVLKQRQHRQFKVVNALLWLVKLKTVVNWALHRVNIECHFLENLLLVFGLVYLTFFYQFDCDLLTFDVKSVQTCRLVKCSFSSCKKLKQKL